MNDVEPPIEADSGILRTPWTRGPRDATDGPVFVSFTDFRARSEADLAQVFETGLRLRECWPIMHGAVGLWLWSRHAELRGGSISVWNGRDDLQRFVRWPVHAAIVESWRSRIEVSSYAWQDERFDPVLTWTRAETRILALADGSAVA